MLDVVLEVTNCDAFASIMSLVKVGISLKVPSI